MDKPQFRKYLSEVRNKSVTPEFRIALGNLKRMYNANEKPDIKELEKDADMISKKNKLDPKAFLTFVKAEFKINEGEQNDDEDDKDLEEVDRAFPKDATPEDKATIVMGRCKSFRTDSAVGYMIKDEDIIQAIKVATEWEWKQSEKYFKDNYKKTKLHESAVGKPGRTTQKDAEDHIDDDLVAEFKKIIKKLGGKTVAKVLLDKLGQKAEIKDEIENIEDIIDNSNY